MAVDVHTRNNTDEDRFREKLLGIECVSGSTQQYIISEKGVKLLQQVSFLPEELFEL